MIERKYFHDLFGGEALPGSIASNIIMVNDPLSVERLSVQLAGVVSVADHYEFRVMTGAWGKLPVTLCSTGIGGGSTSIALDNLVRLGARTIIYVDAGDMGPPEEGALVATGAIRQDGTSLDYARPEFPAASDPEVLMAVIASARDLDIGVKPVLMRASAGPEIPERDRVYEAYNANLEASGWDFVAPIRVTGPEIATVLTLSTLYRVRAGAVYGRATDLETVDEVVDQYFRLVLGALEYLHDWDLEKIRLGWKIMTPAIKMR